MASQWCGIFDYFVDENSDVGYILEVDFEYPEKYHDEHNDLLFCLVHEKPPGSKKKKFLTTLHNEEKYVILSTYLISR